MVEVLLNKILQKEDIRQNLSKLREEIKDINKKQKLAFFCNEHKEEIIDLLNNEDAKTRKNAALLMGDLGKDYFIEPLYEGYMRENQRFVKSAYLNSLQYFDCSIYMGELKEQLRKLNTIELNEDNTKHIQEEIRALSKLIISEEGINTHTFIGEKQVFDCILLGNRNYNHITEALVNEVLPNAELIPFKAGVRVKTRNIEKLFEIRTYKELLIVIPDLTSVPKNPNEAAQKIISSQLKNMLKNAHVEDDAFYFRIELKSKMQLDEKAKFNKKLSSELERLSKRYFINAASNYELEIRLIENKEGSFNVLIKLGTLNDDRFRYRSEHIATSIQPSNAALLVQLAKEYMVDNAQVLDPFCGVGTMLIERQNIVKANTSYGIDYYAPAINKAKVNTEGAGQIIHYINKNILDFKHDYLFDEIFTNMPYATGHTETGEIEKLYRDFLNKAKKLMVPEGVIIMYTHDANLVNKLASKNGYEILDKFEITKKIETWLYVLKRV